MPIQDAYIHHIGRWASGLSYFNTTTTVKESLQAVRLVELFLWRTWPTLWSPGSMPIYTTVPAYINHRKGPYTILATLPTRPS